MFYKQCDENKNIYVWCTYKEDDTYIEMDDNLFAQGFDTNYYLKSFLENPDEDYLKRKKEFEARKTVYNMKKYLYDTDYVIAKISEAQISGDENLVTELRKKYSDVLNKRIEARKLINELEQ